jgi:hypothetical protein
LQLARGFGVVAGCVQQFSEIEMRVRVARIDFERGEVGLARRTRIAGALERDAEVEIRRPVPRQDPQRLLVAIAGLDEPARSLGADAFGDQPLRGPPRKAAQQAAQHRLRTCGGSAC